LLKKADLMAKKQNNKCYLAVHCGHNSSCALMKNGKIIFAAQEERFSRKKNDAGYPYKAIEYCVKKTGITGQRLSGVAYTSTGMRNAIFLKAKHTLNFSIRDYMDYYGDKYYARKLKGQKCLDYLTWLRDDVKFNGHENYFDFSFLKDNKLINNDQGREIFRKESAKTLSRQLDVPEKSVKFLDHHTCHAYYAYFGSPFRMRDCIVITMDSWGNGRNQTVWQVSKDKFKLLAQSDQNDIAHIYKMATLILGMRPDEHEYKVMGLAPYSKKAYRNEPLREIQDLLQVRDMKIVHKNRPRDLFTFLRERLAGYRFDNIAGAIQSYSETLAKQLVRDIYKKTGIGKFVISGGVAMNVKMNKAIADLPCVSSLYVCASGSDESTSIGGCYYLNRANFSNKPLDNMYLGYDVNDEISSFDWSLLKKKYNLKRDVSHREVAGLLAKGDVVARICGKTEFGARALGNRSILADPSRPGIVRKINKAIKNRDFWMPFALAILDEHSGAYIRNPKKIKSPFMTIAFDTLPKKYGDIRAGTHPYDKTVRPQFVTRKNSPYFYGLINEFYKIKGIPAILNTSLNLHGEPIVNCVDDALRTFELSGLDHLLVNNVLVSKKRIDRGSCTA